MTTADWKRAIDELVEMNVSLVQFIGGEPTQHPDFLELAYYALSRKLKVEVFTNLVMVTPELWRLYANPQVQLATSYYSDDAREHAEITHGINAHRLTTKHIGQAVLRGISLRAGIINVQDGQHSQEAERVLRAMGVETIGFDHLREVGRGIRAGDEGVTQLCGGCTSGVIAISPDGIVTPCVFAGFMPVGNVRLNPLSEILAGGPYQRAHTRLTAEFASRPAPDEAAGSGKCNPWCAPNCFPATGVTE
jgi:MoaA/NifB/PqqE/SkfB family radical SAM enzyme